MKSDARTAPTGFRPRGCTALRLVLAMAGLVSVGRMMAAPEFVTTLPLEGLVMKPANLFDLQGKTLRFTPQPNGAYVVESAPTAPMVLCRRVLAEADAEPDGVYRARGWAVPLEFSFPFAGKAWQRLYVNRNGNISFEQPEGAYWPKREFRPDGGMRSVAAAIDSNSAAGLEQMIAVLWNAYDFETRANPQVRVESSRQSLAVTWEVSRDEAGLPIAGKCTFQARLYPSGIIEMSYPKVPERDGIVGLFTGQPVTGAHLHHWQSPGSRADASVAIDAGDIYDNGSTLKFVLTMKNNLPTRVAQGTLAYRCIAQINGAEEQFAANLRDGPEGSSSVGAAPHTTGYRFEGNTAEFYVSKVQLTGISRFAPTWNVTWWGMNRWDASNGDIGTVDLTKVPPPETDLSTEKRPRFGNLFEVFHYPAVTKNSEVLLKPIYRKLPAQDDLALVFTDFRMDDITGGGPGSRQSNFAILGIGGGADKPRSTAELGSSRLQMNMATAWLGEPFFDETGVTPDGVRWRNFARGIQWISHEAVHRWGMSLAIRDPKTGEPLRLGDEAGHWRAGMNAPALWPMAARYLERPGASHSVMGGQVWNDNHDGTFSEAASPWGLPGGLAAHDLYIMGLLPPEKVPESFFLADLKDLGNNRYQGRKVPVLIPDIVATMGPRVPASTQAQKTFQMKLYLVHESGRPVDPKMLERAKKLSAEVAEFFGRASGGVMKIVPSN